MVGGVGRGWGRVVLGCSSVILGISYKINKQLDEIYDYHLKQDKADA